MAKAIEADGVRERAEVFAARLATWRRIRASSWRAIQTRPAAEARVVEALKQHHVDAYVPTETFWRRHMGRKHKQTRPLIRGYVFADLPDDLLHLVHEVDGATRMVTLNGAPVRIDPQFVAELRQAEGAGQYDKTLQDGQRKPLVKGGRARITGGQFSGWIGAVLRVDGERRVRLLISMFGRQTELALKPDQVEALGDDVDPTQAAA
ncbi:MAG TPA: transcription termination/antitermination NusG family protein [Caulobacteraceae bacterium]|jgi:transcription antitermination factor NusG|nr:transcription termination/antitermination NusG family protein [Caulobacteraceae bacterium]